jgi:hypothetical protein
MFESLKALGKKVYIVECLDQVYKNLLGTHARLSCEIRKIEEWIEQLEDIIRDLRNSDGKEEAQIIKDRWQAMKIEEVLELYKIARIKLYEVIDNIPEPIEPRPISSKGHHGGFGGF